MKLKSHLRRRAFTLIEVMIAITIFTLVMGAIYSTWSLILRASRVGQEAAAQAQRQRIAVSTIEEALTCIQSFQASMKYYSFVVDNGRQSTLSFTSRLPDNFPRNGKFGDFNVRRLTFNVEPVTDPVNRNTENDLVLRQTPILMPMDQDEEQRPMVLARNVEHFEVACWDTNQMEWVGEWDNTNAIPPLIRVSLVLGRKQDNGFGGGSPVLSVARVIAVPSQSLPSVVQTPAGGGGAPGGGPGGVLGGLQMPPGGPGGQGGPPGMMRPQ
jgi:prepilin-type N-terminal cleavage/methylation domain-containing protein